MNFGGPIILMCVVNHGVTNIVKFLLEAGVDPNIPDEVIIAITLLLLPI